MKPVVIKIDEIYIPHALRKPLDSQKLEEIAVSIADVGQQTPILVRPDKERYVLVSGLRRIGWTVEKPKAGMFVWAKYPDKWQRKLGSIDFAMKLLEEAEVAVSPGRGFGETGEGFLRLALVENEHRLRQAVRQIARCLKSEPAEKAS